MDIKSLIPVNYNNEEITVLGRDLHAALEIGTDYRHWIKRMIEYGFEEGVDYIQIFEKDLMPVEKDRPLGTVSNTKTNHQLKLDMAKEIAMIQRNEVGRKVRKYFIEVEKQYKQEMLNSTTRQVIDNINIPSYDVKSQALLSAGQRSKIAVAYLGVNEHIAKVHALNEVEKDFDVNLSDWKKLLPAAEDTPVDYNPTQLAEKLNEKTGVKYTARKINAKLDELGYQSKIDGEWVLTDTGKQYGTAYPYERNGHTGFQIRWNEDVLSEFDF